MMKLRCIGIIFWYDEMGDWVYVWLRCGFGVVVGEGRVEYCGCGSDCVSNRGGGGGNDMGVLVVL